MFNKVNIHNIFYSIYIGLFIGALIQLYNGQDSNSSFITSVVMVLISGLIGLVIGSITEFLTSLLPVSMASIHRYYVVNNTIAVVVTLCVLTSLRGLLNISLSTKEDVYMLVSICFIVSACNSLVYIKHKKLNKHLSQYHNSVK